MKVRAIKTRLFQENETLSSFVTDEIKNIPEKSVLVVSSKIVALSEGRVAKSSDFKKLVVESSRWAIKTSGVWLTEKNGMIMANAGIDESNANGKIILSPKNPSEAASSLRKKLMRHYKIKKLGVIVADSALLPLRVGVIGSALGYDGFKGVREYRKKKDLFGRILVMSRTNVADSLATSATLLMGEGNERQPLAIIANAPVEFTNVANKEELRINPREDIFWPLLGRIKKIKK